jgi:hypothetical protein
MLTVWVLPFTPLYDDATGIWQFVGTLETATVPPPPGTFETEYDPFVAVTTEPSADWPVGVTVTVTPASAPPRLLETVPATVPVWLPVVPLVLQPTIRHITVASKAAAEEGERTGGSPVYEVFGLYG